MSFSEPKIQSVTFCDDEYIIQELVYMKKMS